VNILVGCGGSGLKTLAKVNHLLCQDFYWRSAIDEQIYYVVVDTDYRELNDFRETIRHDLSNISRHPWTLPIGLSEGLQSLQRIIEPQFVNRYEAASEPTGQERLLEHWWHEKEDGKVKVFVAPKVVPLTRGAGQCPPVSYFLTWRKLDEIARSLQKMITEIVNRVGGKDNVAVWNVVIVAGLSGGTGRGSWELIAFKIREMLGREGIAANPRAFLFDSSCLEDVMEKHPEQRIPMQANSLTGLSQLSCWVQNQQRSQRKDAAVEYRLPHMDFPDRQESDVLHMRFDEDRNHGAPVNHAYLIFRDNGTTRLPESNDYYEMAGAAIYTALSNSQIDRADITSAFPFVGLAVGTVEVDAASLRNYFELLAGQRLIADMSTPRPDLVDSQLAEAKYRN
ncbi:MAG: tubulin-like doman-containing protein, partial [Planctomycetaceae bacterium]